MGMLADVLAIGPYSPDIAKYLPYGHDGVTSGDFQYLYRSTLPGKLVVAMLFGISEGSSASRDFAACLGIADTWDFNQHKIDPSKIDLERLQSVLSGLGDGQRYTDDLDALIALRAHGFKFFFRPYQV